MTDPARSYQELIARFGAPNGDIAFRRVYAGPALPMSRKVTTGQFAHFETREPPVDVPTGARWMTARAENLDGGPNLANQIAVLDLPHPHLSEDVEVLASCWKAFANAPKIVAQIHAMLADWGTRPLQRILWLSPRLQIDGVLGTIHEDVLGRLRTVVHELASDYRHYETAAEQAMCQTLADRDEVWPSSTDDTYSPGISIAKGWIGRRIADTPCPLPHVAELEASGIRIAALADDEAVLVLP